MIRLFGCFKKRKWPVLLALLLAAFLLVMFKHSLWHCMGFIHMKPIFFDTHSFLSASDCNQLGYDVFIENPCDAGRRVQKYSRLWFLIGYTGLTMEDNNIVGGLTVIIFLLLSVGILAPKNLREFILSAMLLLSPSITLAVERANRDLDLFVMLGLGVYLLGSRSRMFNTISYFLFFLATVLKFYPVASFGVFIRKIKDPKRFWLLVLLTVVALGTFVWMTFPDFEILRKTVPRPQRNAFGASLLFGFLEGGWKILCIIVLLGSLSLLFRLFYSNRTSGSTIQTRRFSTTFFLVGSLTLLFCFCVITNYDYRAVFFVFTLPYFFDLLASENTAAFTIRLINVFFVLLAVMVWAEFADYWGRLIAEGLGKSQLAYYLTKTFMFLKHCSSWGAMMILFVFVVELLEGPLREKIFFLSLGKGHAVDKLPVQ
jgi:hypothetical protein